MLWEVLRLGNVISTQDTARAHVESGARAGMVIVADNQSDGRGRQGRGWISSSGGLYMTAILEVGPHANLMPLVAGVAVAETIRDGFGVEAMLKWPNDVMIGDRKVGGVLLDADWSGDERGIILLGVGVNLNNALPTSLGEATSLSEETGEAIDLDAFLESLLERLDSILSMLKEDPGKVLAQWEALSETLGNRIVIKTSSGEVFEGVAKSIDSDGALELDCDGRSIRVISGTVLGVKFKSKMDPALH